MQNLCRGMRFSEEEQEEPVAEGTKGRAGSAGAGRTVAGERARGMPQGGLRKAPR